MSSSSSYSWSSFSCRRIEWIDSRSLLLLLFDSAWNADFALTGRETRAFTTDAAERGEALFLSAGEGDFDTRPGDDRALESALTAANIKHKY